ncbi:hypothetical protein C0J52_16603 [Blattella germanica]|nr:hypothetical protein C0J52_16603 [Blattella germanica]
MQPRLNLGYIIANIDTWRLGMNKNLLNKKNIKKYKNSIIKKIINILEVKHYFIFCGTS